MAINDKQSKPVAVQVTEWSGNNLSLVAILLGPGVIFYEDGVLEIMTATGRVPVPLGDNIVATPYTAYVPYSPFVAGDPDAMPDPIPDTPEVLEVLWKPGVFIAVVTDAELAAKYEDIP